MAMRIRGAAGAVLVVATLTACPGSSDSSLPATTTVHATSGATYELANTTWTRCNANDPLAGQSYAHAWSFGAGTAKITHDVHPGSTDCTGATDAPQHFEVTMGFDTRDGGGHNVTWDGGAPTGLAYVTANGVRFSVSGVTFPDGSTTRNGLAVVDDGATPARLFITNPGDPVGPVDSMGYPTLLSNVEHRRQ